MRICIIHSSPRKRRGNTFYLAQRVVDRLSDKEETTTVEFFPQDFPTFCTGCFSCIVRDEKLCPHRDKVAPIEEAMLNSDAIIFTSPVYVMSLSGQMKTLLDHFGYLFVIHRSRDELKKVPVMIVSTTAGAGTNHVMSNISRPLKYWGIPKIYKLGVTMLAESFAEFDESKHNRMSKKINRVTDRFYKSVKNRQKLHPNLLYLLMKRVIKRVIKQQPDDNIDKMYWKEKGWIK